MSEPMFVYQCMSCGVPDAAVPVEEAELLHSGCVLVCPECGGETVFNLWNPTQRAAFYGRIEKAEQERDTARKWAAAWKLVARKQRVWRREAVMRFAKGQNEARRWARAWKRAAKAMRVDRASWKAECQGAYRHAERLQAERDHAKRQLAASQAALSDALTELREAREEAARLRAALLATADTSDGEEDKGNG